MAKECQGHSPFLLEGGLIMITNSEEKAEELNAFFAPVFSSQNGYVEDKQPPEPAGGTGS